MIASHHFPSGDDPPLDYVIDVCTRAGFGFTLRRIVRTILEERPDLGVTFPGIWATLIKDKRITFVHDGEERHYKVVGRH